ncbi:TetR/AcrR family transcriptional regulator [Cryptosporangium phraense]|uniref:TetR family transcriptional regulator n=1 Tax=Cryptosporangium phraense TaxID=2593070 RepID=A0A545AVC7_9ACTN|nr:TetR/AcrR family transcriptional regulator [Cryptosporangium phraense]TQS45280.1 TetR family transcriptional regulator [Cryptosporangium phraense]
MAAGRDAIAEAAFGLFATRGYEETSVDDIAAAAGVSRSTFFRAYGSKEAVIFPDHDQLLHRVEERLRSTHTDSALKAVTEAVKIVLFHYVAEGERARERYRLTSAVPALRERELVSGARYQRLFRHYLSKWGDGSESAERRAELTSAAVVAAHNRVLRRWLRGECTDPQGEIEAALTDVRGIFDPAARDEPVAVLVVPPGLSMSQAESAIRRALGST